MKKSIALIVTILIVIPGLVQAENSFRPASPGFMDHNVAGVPFNWRSHRIPHHQRGQANAQALMPPHYAPQWKQSRFPARQAMRPPMPNMQHRQRMSQQRYAPQWNQSRVPARQAMRPPMPNMQHRQHMSQQRYAPQWKQSRFLARQAMRPSMPNMQHRQRMSQQRYAPQWYPQQVLTAQRRAPGYPLYQPRYRSAPHKMSRWPQGNRYQSAAQYKPSNNWKETARFSAVKRAKQTSPWQSQEHLRRQTSFSSSTLPVRGVSYFR